MVQGHTQRPRLPRRSLSGRSSASGASAAYSSVPEEREHVSEISIMRNLCHPNIVRLMEVIGVLSSLCTPQALFSLSLFMGRIRSV